MSADDLLKEAAVALQRTLDLPHQASALAMKLFRLREMSGEAVGAEVAALTDSLKCKVKEAGLGNVLEHQLRYATTLASSPGLLSYEELHKLLSICDEIDALQTLGFDSSPEWFGPFEVAVRQRLTQQRADARMAAENRADDSNRERWWYSSLLRATFLLLTLAAPADAASSGIASGAAWDARGNDSCVTETTWAGRDATLVHTWSNSVASSGVAPSPYSLKEGSAQADLELGAYAAEIVVEVPLEKEKQ